MVGRLMRGKRGIALGLLGFVALALAVGVLARGGELGAPGRSTILPLPGERPARGYEAGQPLPFPAEAEKPTTAAQPPKGAAQPQAGLVAPGSAAAPAERVAAPAARPSTGGQADLVASSVPWDRMVIRQASLSLQVESVEAALQRVRDIARASGGFVDSSSTHIEKIDDRERPVATIVIQVRSDAFDNAVQALRQIAVKVESENGSSQDVTEEYVDLESNLRNLQAAEAALLRLMDRATRIEDVLALQRELTSIRGQIERLQGRKRFLERRTEMAIIAVRLRLPPLEAPRPQVSGKGWDPLAAAQRGWEASLAILRQAADGVIVVLAFSWWLAPLLALAVYLWSGRRGRSRLPAPRPES